MTASTYGSRRRNGAAKRPRGWWYPWLFVAGLGFVVAVNGVMIAFAVDSFSGLGTAHPYERGLDYNRTLAAVRAQEALGWQVSVDAAPVGQGPLPRPLGIEARFLDHEGRELDGLAVEAVLVRPAVRGHDLAMPLLSRGGGRYVASVELPMRGQWELRILAEDQDTTWQSSRRILVP